MLRGLLRIFLVAAFLVAQTAGVAHQAWHDAGAAAHANTDAGDSKAPKSPLCDFHTALASVLGALSSAHAAPTADDQQATQFAAAESTAARFSLLASRSRGPPSLL